MGASSFWGSGLKCKLVGQGLQYDSPSQPSTNPSKGPVVLQTRSSFLCAPCRKLEDEGEGGVCHSSRLKVFVCGRYGSRKE